MMETLRKVHSKTVKNFFGYKGRSPAPLEEGTGLRFLDLDQIKGGLRLYLLLDLDY